MPLWFCEWETCRQPAVQRAGDCLLCDRHLCRTHLHRPWHECPTPEEDEESYRTQWPQSLLPLRGGVPCTVELSRSNLSAMMGGQNCHVEITFQDDVRWLARFRLIRTSSPPRPVREYILRSEAATMIYLQQHTRIPTPRIFDWACESDRRNSIGADYILMEKLDGKPLDWNGATPDQRERVMQQLADVFLEIERHPFKAMGSLVSAGDGAEFEVQGLAHQATFRTGCGGLLGPFSSSLEGSRAILESYLEMIASGEIEACRPADVYLAHRYRLDIIQELFPSGGQFFLQHPDDKGDHILVNGSFDIVGLIDWEWTQTVSRANAFCSPCMMWPVSEFYNGSNSLATDEMRLADIFRERGREDLAKYVMDGRKLQRFFFALGPDGAFLDRQTFVDLFSGLRRAFDSRDEGWEQWKVRALENWKSDESLRRLLELEESKETQVVTMQTQLWDCSCTQPASA
ncbi:hypothetical protein TOPH_05029 [Tolypocladium ophioglossoides CBS 100239]|uniref:Aminoglycoside phosphotransferase domain-containing protein n=1 Tax=Tolypocladium ophioglossoides (strain CBS 100239) TaxID=1163406 RepID=A0A0L0N8R7_TOLOC|nr:hypothetical protein TOPH_05029 [Tolypocladium ophioglossoides CBS 100239]